jgi:hypothetical protein
MWHSLWTKGYIILSLKFNFMKKFFLIMLVVTATGLSVQAQTDSSRKSNYYYYPQSNVYFNPGTKNYSYYDSSSMKWNTGQTLPSQYNINAQTPKSSINYSGTQIWSDNKQHQLQYGTSTMNRPTPTPSTPATSPTNPVINNTGNPGGNPPPKPVQ